MPRVTLNIVPQRKRFRSSLSKEDTPTLKDPAKHRPSKAESSKKQKLSKLQMMRIIQSELENDIAMQDIDNDHARMKARISDCL